VNQRYTYNNMTDLKTSHNHCKDNTFVFYCAQWEGKQTKNKKVDDSNKRWACMKMDRYLCYGTLCVTVDDGDQMVKVWMKHTLPHPGYTDISLPAVVLLQL
jgi:hypothetical protein